MAKCMHFNRESIERILSPQNKDRDEYRDRKEPGLYLYCSRGGSKTFHLYQKFKNKPLRVKIGRYPEFSVTAAREKAREIKGLLARGELPESKVKVSTLRQVTVGAIGEEYIDVRNLSKNSKKIYQGRIDVQLSSWNTLPIVEVDKRRLIALHSEIAEKSGKHMADLTMRVFRAFYNYFMDRYDYPGPNPAKTLSVNRLWKTNKADRRQGILSKKDLPKWFKTVMRHDSKDERDYLLLLLMTGMRKTEAVRLRWEDIDFENRMFTAYETKNRKPISLPMTNYLEELFRSRLPVKGKMRWVFPSSRVRGKPMHVDALAHRIQKMSGITLNLHDLRRTFITYADELDFSDYVLKKLVNHSTSSDVTAGYIISEVERLREPAESVQKFILSMVKPQNDL